MDQPRLDSTATVGKQENKKIPVILAILISVIVVNNVFYMLLLDGNLVKDLSSFMGILIFASLASSTYGLGWYIVSHFIKRIDTEVGGKSRYFNWIYRGVRIVFYLTAAAIAVAIFQMVLTSQYYVILSVVAMASGFALGAIILGMLGYRFLSWFRLKRDISIFLYGLALATAALGAAMIGFVNTALFLIDEPLKIEPLSSNLSTEERPEMAKSSTSSELFQVTLLPFRLAFGLYWIATVLLLRNYSKSFGRFKFWTVVSLPLLYYTVGNIFYNGSVMPSVAFDLVISLTVLIVSSLFASIFFLIARSIRRQKVGSRSSSVVHYLTISGYGTIVLTVTISSPVHFVDYEQTPYPPFADVPWSFVGFATYLFSIGFYFSAISISQDIRLRQSIRRIATTESKLIDDIGTAQMEQQIQQKVLQVTKEQEELLQRQTGIGQSLSTEEVKQYCDEAIEKIRRLREQK